MVKTMKFKDSNNFAKNSKFIKSSNKVEEVENTELEARRAMYKNKKEKEIERKRDNKRLEERRASDDKQNRERSKDDDSKNKPNKSNETNKTSKIKDESAVSTDEKEVDIPSKRKEQDPSVKKKAAKKSISSVIDFRGKVKEDLHDAKFTGDAFKDGNKGAVGLYTTLANPFTYLKMLIKSLIALIAPFLIAGACIILVFAFIVVFIIAIATNTSRGYNGIEGFLGNCQVDGKMHQSLSEAEINDIKRGLFMTESQDKAVTFALSKVGFAYSQPLRTSGRAYDCSSLAYYVYMYAGIDLSNGGGYPPTADAEARYFLDRGMAISTSDPNFSLSPGDLVFYAKEGDSHFMGIYHVAIYIGNGYAAEALNTKYGVVYQPLRTKNAILVGHILQ